MVQPDVPQLGERSSGVLLHPTSLPGPHGCGDAGPSARRFVDFLARAAQRWWMMLPVGPAGYGESPYSAQSAFAGNPLFVALEPLVERGWLEPSLVEGARDLPRDRVDYAATERLRARALRAAFVRIDRAGQRALDAFRDEARAWLPDFALYRALKRAHDGREWTQWEPDVRDRQADALARARQDLAGEVAFEEFVQWLFAEQWRDLRAYCKERGVGLIGDMPIFVAHDSADVWQHRDLFRLDERGEPTVVAGVPPDYFSATGQRWGNPLYRWSRLAKTGYRWWIDRVRGSLARFDVVRLDHFIGFQRYWEIPASEPTAQNGRWMKGPRDALFEAIREDVGGLPLIAEDLGAVTPGVRRLRDRLGLHGMRVLQFAFGTDPSATAFLPHNHRRRSVVFTGTHDNDTTVGWFEDPGGAGSERSPEQAAKERRIARAYLGIEGDEPVPDIHWRMIRLAMMSVADTAIFPMQDLLGLGSGARMNSPGKGPADGVQSWAWRAPEEELTRELAERLARMTRLYGRAAQEET